MRRDVQYRAMPQLTTTSPCRDLAWYAIRVCTICPSIFETPLSVNIPPRARQRALKGAEFPARFGRPDEFAHAAQMLIENDMLNGLALSECERAERVCD